MIHSFETLSLWAVHDGPECFWCLAPSLSRAIDQWVEAYGMARYEERYTHLIATQPYGGSHALSN